MVPRTAAEVDMQAWVREGQKVTHVLCFLQGWIGLGETR